MKKVFKIILIAELIILFLFVVGYFVFEQNYVPQEVYGICNNISDFKINESLLN